KGEIKSSRQYEKLRAEVAEITRRRNLERAKLGLNPFAGEQGSRLARKRAQKAVAEGRCALSHISPEEKSKTVKEYWSSMTLEERKQKAQKQADSRSPEFKAEIARRSAAARKANDEKIEEDRRKRMVRVNLLR